MPRTPAADLTPGDTYTAGDPTNPANTLTVTAPPYTATFHSRWAGATTILRIPVRTQSGTELDDVVYPDHTVTKTN